MKWALFLLVLVLACTPQTTQTNSKEATDGGYFEGKEITWRASLRVEHPEWFVCEKDTDCLGLQGICGSSCRAESTNNVGYSDYVVEFSKVCQGSGRTIRDCPRTDLRCHEGSCMVEVLE